jgi:hypothetical protein
LCDDKELGGALFNGNAGVEMRDELYIEIMKT